LVVLIKRVSALSCDGGQIILVGFVTDYVDRRVLFDLWVLCTVLLLVAGQNVVVRDLSKVEL
jgi:hypothetical protein